jgi:hypothetical protein
MQAELHRFDYCKINRNRLKYPTIAIIPGRFDAFPAVDNTFVPLYLNIHHIALKMVVNKSCMLIVYVLYIMHQFLTGICLYINEIISRFRTL